MVEGGTRDAVQGGHVPHLGGADGRRDAIVVAGFLWQRK